MHDISSAQRLTPFTIRDHHAGAAGQRGAAQSSATAGTRGVPPEPGEHCGRLGHLGESSRSGGEGDVWDTRAGTVAAVSAATAIAATGRAGRKLKMTNARDKFQDGVQTSTPVGPGGRLNILAWFVKLLALGMIRFYQACLSPVLPAACRYHPSCSAYAFEAIDQWGVWRGVRLAFGRLLRCRPWGGYGYDPVPEKPGLETGG